MYESWINATLSAWSTKNDYFTSLFKQFGWNSDFLSVFMGEL